MRLLWVGAVAGLLVVACGADDSEVAVPVPDDPVGSGTVEVDDDGGVGERPQFGAGPSADAGEFRVLPSVLPAGFEYIEAQLPGRDFHPSFGGEVTIANDEGERIDISHRWHRRVDLSDPVSVDQLARPDPIDIAGRAVFVYTHPTGVSLGWDLTDATQAWLRTNTLFEGDPPAHIVELIETITTVSEQQWHQVVDPLVDPAENPKRIPHR